MVEAAKQCASNPSDPESQQTLKTAAENLRSTTHAAVGTTIKRKMIKRLENASKHAAATATQCIAASQGAGGHNTNGMSQDELMESCKAVADVIPRLVLFLILKKINTWTLVIVNSVLSPILFTNERLFTIQAFTITRVHCITNSSTYAYSAHRSY